MKKIIKIIFSAFVVLILFLLINLNIKQFYQPQYISQNNHILNKDVIEQLHFLKGKIHAGEAEKMQELFPEGFVFMNVIYGLTWCELVSQIDHNSPLYQEAMTEIDWTIKEVNSEQAKATFEASLPLQYGAFYQGWSNLLLGKKLSIQANNERKIDEAEQFRWKCQQISIAYSETPNLLLNSYSDGVWQADNVICIASLALHDEIFPEKYKLLKEDFIFKLKSQLDIKTGLIPHSKKEKLPRGSSQGLMCIFLPKIDSIFAKQIFDKYKNTFLKRKLSLLAVREFPKGIDGNEDVDSGPIIWDIGGVASIVGIKATAVNNDAEISKKLRNNIEGLGIPLVMSGQKRYFLGTFPMADVFIAWANVSQINEKNDTEEASVQFSFHLISVLIFLVCLISLYFIYKT